MSNKLDKLTKAAKVLGKDTMEELQAMDANSLRKRISEANEAMREAEDDLEGNVEYQKAKENLKTLTSGKREVFKRQKAIIRVALSLLSG